MLDYEIYNCILSNKSFEANEYNSCEALIYKAIEVNNYDAFVILEPFVDKYNLLTKCIDKERIEMIKYLFKNYDFSFLSKSSSEYCIYLSLKNFEIFKIVLNNLINNRFNIINVFKFDIKSVNRDHIIYLYKNKINQLTVEELFNFIDEYFPNENFDDDFDLIDQEENQQENDQENDKHEFGCVIF